MPSPRVHGPIGSCDVEKCGFPFAQLCCESGCNGYDSTELRRVVTRVMRQTTTATTMKYEEARDSEDIAGWLRTALGKPLGDAGTRPKESTL